MKISYKNNLQDIIDLNIYNANNSSVTKKSFRIALFVIPLLFMGYSVFFSLKEGRISPFFTVLALVLSALWIIFYPGIFRWRVAQVVTKRVKEGQSNNLFCDTNLTLDEEGITKESEFINSKVSWSSIEKVAVTNKHIFIFINYANAFAIPLSAFSSKEEKDSFTKLVHEYTGKQF